MPLPGLLRLVLLGARLVVVLGVKFFELGLKLPKFLGLVRPLGRGLDERPRGGRLGGGRGVVPLAFFLAVLAGAAGDEPLDGDREQGEGNDGPGEDRQEGRPPTDPDGEFLRYLDLFQPRVRVGHQGLSGKRPLLLGFEPDRRRRPLLELEPLIEGQGRLDRRRGPPPGEPDRQEGPDPGEHAEDRPPQPVRAVGTATARPGTRRRLRPGRGPRRRRGG